MLPPPNSNAALAPSIEKAYYRKCIQLKRRLTEIENANNEALLRRKRVDRSILKMRLERAFLLEQLNKRKQPEPDLSDGSEDEPLVTPPVDRPHRDKRRRPHQSAGQAQNEGSHVERSMNGETGRSHAGEDNAGGNGQYEAMTRADDEEDDGRLDD